MKIWSMLTAALCSFAIIGCASDPGTEPAPKGDKPESIDMTDTSSLTPAQQEMAKARGASGEGSSEGDAGETER